MVAPRANGKVEVKNLRSDDLGTAQLQKMIEVNSARGALAICRFPVHDAAPARSLQDMAPYHLALLLGLLHSPTTSSEMPVQRHVGRWTGDPKASNSFWAPNVDVDGRPSQLTAPKPGMGSPPGGQESYVTQPADRRPLAAGAGPSEGVDGASTLLRTSRSFAPPAARFHFGTSICP
eukprot:COSAG06_NODE_8600_length_2118_cov_3.915305_3_plen_176_part_01